MTLYKYDIEQLTNIQWLMIYLHKMHVHFVLHSSQCYSIISVECLILIHGFKWGSCILVFSFLFCVMCTCICLFVFFFFFVAKALSVYFLSMSLTVPMVPFVPLLKFLLVLYYILIVLLNII